ncbi:Hok/Gef family protein [Photobacterium frigidiphilum]|uniref:Hok/Gef family protein n=1 Tax=Photobacterium frigidiphilum TaxID=264736 RepID=UPI002693DC07|nr:Hok/Gef family protein [Photobacterium frigidiphilum]
MYLDNSDVSLSYQRGQAMLKRNFPIRLLIVCFTLLIALALVRDDLCSIQYQDGKKLFKAVLSYEVRD